jgi:hypothetical protein
LGQDPLIGTWNFHGANLDGSNPFIAVMTFNAGGTTVEFDTAGTNSSASPGESIVLGKWSQTAVAKYTFKEQNYVYDKLGSLSLIAIAGCKLDLASNMKHLSGPCTLSFYQCSVKQCPGSLVAGPIAFHLRSPASAFESLSPTRERGNFRIVQEYSMSTTPL